MKKVIALAATVLMAAGIFSGCTLVQVDAEADGNRVVAVVNGEKILKKDWYSVYYMYYMYYGSSADQETLEQLKTTALDSLIYQTLWEQKAKDIGPLEADIVSKYDELKKEQTESFTDSAKDEYVSAFNDGTIIVKNLAGYSLVQHILINFDEDDQENIQELYMTRLRMRMRINLSKCFWRKQTIRV